MADTKERSPLRCIPSADAVRRRLDAVLVEARKLRILLRTASQIERAADEPKREGQSRE